MENRIREFRLSRGLTLEKFGKKIGKKKNTISQYEHGIIEPKLETWKKMAEVLIVPVPYLQGLTAEPGSYEDKEIWLGFQNMAGYEANVKSEFSKYAVTELAFALQGLEKIGNKPVTMAATDSISSIGSLLTIFLTKPERQQEVIDDAANDFKALLNTIKRESPSMTSEYKKQLAERETRINNMKNADKSTQ